MNLKKKLSFATLVCLASIGQANAFATDDLRYYLGGELDYAKIKYFSAYENGANAIGYNLQRKIPGVSLLAGVRVNNNFSTEVGYTYLRKAKAGGIGTSNDFMQLSTFYADFIGSYAIQDKIDLLGSVGIGRTSLKEANNINGARVTESFHKMNYRLGVGARFNINEHWDARAMVRCQKIGKSKYTFVKGYMSATLGLTYTF